MAAISVADVREQLSAVEPEQPRTHAVRIDGRLFPVKQAYAAVTGDDRLDFNTVKARRFFKRLGFDVIRLDG